MSTTYSVDRDTIIKGSLRLIGYLGEGAAPTAEDTINVSEALNMLVKSWITKGIPLWTVETIVVPLKQNQVAYSVGPTGADHVCNYVTRILEGTPFVRDAFNFDTPVALLAREEYMSLSAKSTGPSVINSIYYDPQLPNGVVYVYPAPNDSSRSLYFSSQRYIQDMLAATDLPDFPSSWYLPLRWCLAEEIMLDYGVPMEIRQAISARAGRLLDEIVNFASAESASTFFSPNLQGTFGVQR
jgi:hypothetical protein